VYRAGVSRRGADDRWLITVGRQPSTAVAAVGVFDGVSAELGGARIGVGLFTGTQPDPTDYSHSTDLAEHGVYVTVRGRPAGSRQWNVSSGLVGSYGRSAVDREFVHFQGRYGGPRLDASATQEIDYNRGWKSDAGEDAVSMTATFFSLSYRITDRLSARSGYDGRRNVRLYRDFESPEIEFDDSYRRGVWGGLSARIAQRFTVGVDGRSSDGGGAGEATAVTLSLGAHRVARRLGFRARSTSYENELATGWLHSGTIDFHAGRLVQLQLGGGTRREQHVANALPDETLAWVNLEMDVAVGRRWYWILSSDLLRGEMEDVDQYYGRLTYRF
jgi:hypothetical protein